MDVAQRFARVFASAIWGWVAVMLLRALGLEFSPETAATIESAMVIFFAAVINAGIAAASKHFPWLEWLLIVPVRPAYFNEVQRDRISVSSLPPDIKKKV